MRSAVKKKLTWLLLLFRLPATQKAERVAMWRKLKKSGAIQITTSTYLLPDEPARYECFQWLTKEIRDAGGDATLVRAREIEGLSKDKLVDLFNAARDKEYGDLKKAVQSFIARQKKSDAELAMTEIARLTRQFRELREIDFFDSARGHEVAMLLRRAEEPRRSRKLQVLDARQYRGKTWLTRPRPEIDRVGSAWLISKFIDPKANFVFAPTAQAVPEAIPFDMLDAEFSHHGNCCTFETLTKRFAISDRSVAKIGEMIHDADLGDSRFQRVEGVGIDRVFKGWAKEGAPDDEILRRGFECFSALYAFLQRR
jgi:hypothetical protein